MDIRPESRLPWDDEQELLGLRVRAFFFDPATVGARHDWIDRALPVLTPVRPTTLHAAGERGQYAVAELIAHPDAVFEHGNGLICLLDRSEDQRDHDPATWPNGVRGDALVQAVVAAVAVAGQRQTPTVALLRCHNVLYQIDPSPAALECIATSIVPAKRYCGAEGSISVQQLAAYCEPRLRNLPAGGAVLTRSQCDIGFADTTPSVAGIAEA
ncbi:hypothetical protein HLB44_14835 [Aquincola sp. S2]|uniref:Uncharacterized protein n=1 Tax=Pseudaquabacterium terrae TaxID=2732868 RepID=A0ABX2EI50_9BURK|nr:hypothetical protein [Aquabacterium terrae]NRF68266.1 hypothetical protein [Aquabacterium terrae]